MFLESKLVKFTIDSGRRYTEVFWQYPLVIPSQLEVVQPFVGQGWRFGGFSQRLMSQPPLTLLHTLHWKRRFFRRSSVGVPACSRRGILEVFESHI